jgi:hypothetical protein
MTDIPVSLMTSAPVVHRKASPCTWSFVRQRDALEIYHRGTDRSGPGFSGRHSEAWVQACFFFVTTYIYFVMITSRHISTLRAGRLLAGD